MNENRQKKLIYKQWKLKAQLKQTQTTDTHNNMSPKYVYNHTSMQFWKSTFPSSRRPAVPMWSYWWQFTGVLRLFL